jgi:sugar/nucleoside kinase (ribokinase family)
MEPRGLFVGLTTIDIQYLVDTFPALNSKTVAGTFAMSVGGPATNAAVAFAHLGGKCHLMSAIGNNQFTTFIESELRHYNVEFTDLSPLADKLPTVSSIVTSCGGQRTVITTASPLTNSKDEKAFIAGPNDYDVVLVDGFNMETCCMVAAQAKQRGKPVVLDGGSWKDGMERLLPSIDIVICSEHFFAPDGGDEDSVMKYLARQGVRYRAITRGERPIIYSVPEGNGEIEIGPQVVVDTLGAGDILHGAFCYFYALGNNFVPALLDASRIAMLSCQTLGTRSWMKR